MILGPQFAFDVSLLPVGTHYRRQLLYGVSRYEAARTAKFELEF